MTPPTAVTDAPTVEGDPPQLTLDEQRAVLRSLIEKPADDCTSSQGGGR